MVSSISSSGSDYIAQMIAQMQQKMQLADTDGTKGLSKDELASINTSSDVGGSSFLNKLTANFDKIDTNGDGQLTGSEISAAAPPKGAMGPPPGLSIDSSDANDSADSTDSTDATSSTSASSFMEALLKKLLQAVEDSLEKMTDSSTSADNTDSTKTAATNSSQKLDLTSADTDGTAGLSKTELSSIDTSADPKAAGFIDELSKNFDKLDADGDGQLSKSEIAAAKPQHMHHHGHTIADATTAATSTNSSSNSNSDSSNSGSSTISNLSDFLLKQLSNAYKNNSSLVSSSLNLAG